MRETTVDLHALVQEAGDAIIVADVQGRIVLWNRGFFGVRVIFPCRRCVRQNSHIWTARAAFGVFEK
jgi:hypothetical protein